jgi:molybdopterin-containing oxidoreductase family iron-sulfur binding subunit
LSAQQAAKGTGIRILTETVASPTLGAQIQEFLSRFPQAKWVQWEPFGRHNVREGSRLAFGEYVDAHYAIDQADVILSLDADFLCAGNGGLKHARAFASRRRIEGDRAELSRFYAVESTPTNSGSKADHRLPLRAAQIESFARAVASALGVGGAGSATLPEAAQRWIAPLVKDLQAAKTGRSLVLAGEGQPAVVHALAHAMNAVLGSVGTTVTYTQAAEVQPVDQRAALKELAGEMNAGSVGLLLILGGNPVYNAPADLRFAEAMDKVAVRAHLGLYHDETAALCHWHIPETHYLETWSDVRADDGTVSIVQPLIAPLYGGRSVHEVMSALGEGGARTSYDVVRSFWASSGTATTPAGSSAQLATPQGVPGPFDQSWRKWLHDGIVANTAFPPKTVTLQASLPASTTTTSNSGELEIVFRPDPSVHDGRFANNAWLQELPKSLTKLTWDNAALIAPATADRLMLVSGDVVELKQGSATLRIPVWIAPGHPLETLTLHMGYGRTRAGRAANGIGFNVNALRTLAAQDIGSVQLAKTGDTYELACTQDHWSIEGRNIIRQATIEDFEKDPAFAGKMEHQQVTPLTTMYPNYDYSKGYQWGMTIDQNVCTGCNSCVVACQAENNVPVVGKSQVLNGREMHWLRVDRYYTGELDHPGTYHQPMPCQQCETAPCEVVCPVAATVHNAEGLNDMVYNRCVGTRYCSNNCPYKVRRFNFMLYADFDTPSYKLMRNPDVTVRSRGVMEKCTYCVQRINHARVAAKLEDREIRDGDIVTACQAACPTEAIVFGNINDPDSKVSKTKASPLNYPLLAELNTRPRTTYLAVVRNPNRELPDEFGAGGEEGH